MLHRCAHGAEQRLEVSRPLLLQLFLDKRQLTQMVGIAQRVTSGVKVAITRPAVMHTHSLIARQDPNGFQGGRATSGVAGIVGQGRGARHMRPFQSRVLLAHHAQPRLVMVQHWRVAQRHLDLVFNALQPLGSLPHQIDQRANREGRAEEIGEELTHTRIRHELLLDQVGAQRTEPGTVLLRGSRAGWRLGLTRRPTRRAAHMHDAVFGHGEPHWWQFLHLPPLDPAGRIPRKLLPAGAALARPMGLDLVRSRHQRHLMTRMSHLAPTLLAALLPQTLGLASQPITRRRLTTVVAVLGQPAFQLLHTRQQRLRLHLLAQGCVFGS